MTAIAYDHISLYLCVMKRLALILTLIFPLFAFASDYVYWPSFYVEGVYELSPVGNYMFKGRHYKKINLPANEPIDTPIGEKLASKVYQVVDPEGDDLGVIVVFKEEPYYDITNHNGVVCYTIATVEKPKGIKGLEQYPDTYTTTFIKWYMDTDY